MVIWVLILQASFSIWIPFNLLPRLKERDFSGWRNIYMKYYGAEEKTFMQLRKHYFSAYLIILTFLLDVFFSAETKLSDIHKDPRG